MPTTLIPPTHINPAPEPPDRRDRNTFNLRARNWAAYQKDELSPGINATLDNVYNNALFAHEQAEAADDASAAADEAAARAESAANNASDQWNPAKNYVIGERVFVLTHPKFTYRRITNGVTATPPPSDPANWTQINGNYVELTKPLVAGSNLNIVVASGFYELSTSHVNAPEFFSGGQLIVSRGGASCMQQVSGTNGDFYARVGNTTTGVWKPWQRMLGDGTVLEKYRRWDAVSYVKFDPADGTVAAFVVSANLTIDLVHPRTASDQFTLRLIPYGGSVTFSGSPTFLPRGIPMPNAAIGDVLTLGFLARRENNGWDIFIGGIHP